jgi:hypothetical protein
MFYSDTGLPTLNRDNRIICNVTHINTFLNSLDTTLSNNPLCFLTGHWFSRPWVNARTMEWFTPAVKATYQVTLTATQTIPKPLSEHLLEDWRSSWTPPSPGDHRRFFTPLGEPPDLSLHPFVQGVLTARVTHIPVSHFPNHHQPCLQCVLLILLPPKHGRQHNLPTLWRPPHSRPHPFRLRPLLV